MLDAIAQAATAFDDRRWSDVVTTLGAVPAEELVAADLERLGVAAFLTGRDDASVTAWERAHHRHLDDGAPDDAARCGFWAAFCLMMQGQMGHAGGWLQRVGELLGGRDDCAAAGFLRIPQLLQAIDAGDADRACQLAVEATEIADRCGDADLAAFATLGHGQALLALGDHEAGMALLDAVMLSVSGGEAGPIVTGVAYCAVLLECMQLFDLARAAEWTESLDAWCASQPDLVPYRGQCLVHQSQLRQASGEWSDALATVATARRRLSDPPHPALGLAWYQEGELARLRGDLGAAGDAYREASRAGYNPMPGLALLELVRGEPASAAASIERALVEAGQPFERPRLLDAAVEIHVAAGDPSAARRAADELRQIATGATSDMLTALADHADGAVCLAEGRASEALGLLRSASTCWRRLRLPYETARSGELIGRACAALDDHASARLELEGALETYVSLGAGPDEDRIRGVIGGDRPSTGGLLSARELEVLGEVASGKTNREAAESLSISPHTVGRHLENIFSKLGVTSRAAAIAAAYERDLL